MAGIFDPDTIAGLIGLTRSPRVQYLKNTARSYLPYVGGPLSTNTPRGAMPRKDPNVGTFRSVTRPDLGGASDLLNALAGGMNAGKTDPMMDLYQQLIDQLQQPVQMPQAVDTEDLMRQVRAALDPIYNQRAASAQAQGERNRGEVTNMYKALSNDYKELAPQQAEQAKAAQAQVEQLYGQLRSNIQGDYSRVSQEQGDLFKQLGIESALPDVLEEQQAPVQDALTAAAENQTQQAQRYMDIGNMDQTYYREGSPNALMQGNEINTDMLAQLQDYLQQIEAERASGIQSAYMDQLGQANSQLGQMQQSAQSEANRRQEMLWQILQSQMQGGQQQQALTPDSFMGSLPPDQQQSVAGAFTQLQRSPEAIYGKVEDPRNPVPGSFVETTPQWYMAQADQMLQQGQLDPTTYQALLMYLQLYFKQGQ